MKKAYIYIYIFIYKEYIYIYIYLYIDTVKNNVCNTDIWRNKNVF